MPERKLAVKAKAIHGRTSESMEQPLAPTQRRAAEAQPTWIHYTALMAVTILCVIYTHHLRTASLLRVPLYGLQGDGSLTALLAKMARDNLWIFSDPRLGFPFHLLYYDFAQGDALHILALKVIGISSGSAMAAINLYYLAGYPLAAITSFYVLRKHGISLYPAATAALLYVFLPGHMIRAYGHLAYSSYYLLPLAIDVILRIAGIGAGEPLRMSRKVWLIPVMISVGIGLNTAYYCFYYCVFLIVAIGYALVKLKRRDLAALGCLCGATAFLALLLSIAPAISYKLQNGPNSSVAERLIGESDIYGLKISTMLLPSTFHPIAALRKEKQTYVLSFPSLLANESEQATLGCFGVFGFLVSLVCVLFQVGQRRLRLLGLFSVAGVLFATTGGFGSLFSLVVTPVFRANNRISFYLAFFAIFATALVLDQILRHWRSGVAAIVCGILLLLGLFDQVPAMVIPNPGLFVAPWIKQANFIRDLEQHLRPESAVLQLPYVRFPESPAIGTMMLYEQIQPYIQSDRLKWSYPIMDGRPGAEWMASLCSRPPEELLQSAVASGFSAIYITMAGYPDGGASLITALRNLLQAEPLRSPDGRNAVFLIANYGSRLKASLGDAGWQRLVSQLGPPQVLLSWGQGFYTSESGGGKTWRWARAHAAIRVLNRTGRNATVPLSMRIYASFGQPRPASVEISGDSLDDRFQATEAGVPTTVTLHLHPGTNEIKLDTNGTKVVAPQDPRDMHMRVEEVHLGPIS